MASRIKLADYIERKADAGSIIVELQDGSEVTIPPAELWSQAVYDGLRDGDVNEACRHILGERYEAFIADGGNWRILNGIIEEAQGIDAGK